MRRCAIGELKQGETVLARYPNGELGTAIVLDIVLRNVYLKANWESTLGEYYWTMHVGMDYGHSIYKIDPEWDAEVNL
jgi:hypothetical protein